MSDIRCLILLKLLWFVQSLVVCLMINANLCMIYVVLFLLLSQKIYHLKKDRSGFYNEVWNLFVDLYMHFTYQGGFQYYMKEGSVMSPFFFYTP